MPTPRACLLIAATLTASWLGMQQVHELGHVVAGLATGGRIERVVLHPLEISRTDLSANPRPGLVTWAGPALGCLLPLALWGAVRRMGCGCEFLLRFFAGFCLIANGAYVGVGSLGGIGDAGDLLRSGSPRWSLWLFGAVCVPSGLALWNGLGPRFGIGRDAPPIAGGWLAVAIGAALGTAAISLAVGR
ncbi:MAG: M50 family metallopeptidase [Planctomyces sp.]|nr:M50 family metallopeptidase [Planctomyces sp.]